MKKIYWYFIIGILAVAAIIVVWAVKDKAGSGKATTPENLAANTPGEAQVQTYLASGTPTVKDGDKMFGDKDAVLPIFVYEDYSNKYSADLADTLDKIKAESGDKVAVVVRPFALANSVSAAKLAMAVDCAGEQGKWKEMRALLFAQAKNQQLLSDNLDNYVSQLELKADDFNTCLTNVEKSGKIEQSVAEAQKYGVQGAPTMFIGGEMVLGARPYEDFVDSNGDKIAGLKSVVAGKIN